MTRRNFEADVASIRGYELAKGSIAPSSAS
jgi:hypothetical protein